MKTFKQFSEELTNEGFLKAAAITAAMLPAAGAIAKKFLKPKFDNYLNKEREKSLFGGNKRVDDTRKGSGDKKVGEKIYFGK